MAPRFLARLWDGFSRGALWASILVVAVSGAQGSQADTVIIESADFADPTKRYGHLVLGKDHNWDTLEIKLSDGTRHAVRHSELVFEDTRPRLIDIDGDDKPEVLTVESGTGLGARLVIYGLRDGTIRLVAATPHIGQTNRWFAPIGAADLDGDGAVEVAFVDRPHLAKVLRIWRYREGQFTEAATAPALTNHRIGWDYIEGGLRACDGRVEMILASGNWARLMSIRFDGADLTKTDIGPYTPDQIAAALTCK